MKRWIGMGCGCLLVLCPVEAWTEEVENPLLARILELYQTPAVEQGHVTRTVTRNHLEEVKEDDASAVADRMREWAMGKRTWNHNLSRTFLERMNGKDQVDHDVRRIHQSRDGELVEHLSHYPVLPPPWKEGDVNWGQFLQLDLRSFHPGNAGCWRAYPDQGRIHLDRELSKDYEMEDEVRRLELWPQALAVELLKETVDAGPLGRLGLTIHPNKIRSFHRYKASHSRGENFVDAFRQAELQELGITQWLRMEGGGFWAVRWEILLESEPPHRKVYARLSLPGLQGVQCAAAWRYDTRPGASGRVVVLRRNRFMDSIELASHEVLEASVLEATPELLDVIRQFPPPLEIFVDPRGEVPWFLKDKSWQQFTR